MSNLTDPNKIISENADFIKKVKRSFIDLNESCITFINRYDDYNNKNLYDASLLKERMKTAVLKAVSHDI